MVKNHKAQAVEKGVLRQTINLGTSLRENSLPRKREMTPTHRINKIELAGSTPKESTSTTA